MKKLILSLLTAAILLAACGNQNSLSQREIDNIKNTIEMPNEGDGVNAREREPDTPHGNAHEPVQTQTQARGGASFFGDILTYVDDTHLGGWFDAPRPLELGAQEAHELTGVKFGIWACNDILGNTSPSVAELEDFSFALYQTLFEDSQEHLLLVWVDLGDGYFNAMDVIGSQARVLFTDVAMNNLFDELEYYWHFPERYTESEMFGLALAQTARWIAQQNAPRTSGVHKNENLNIVTPLSEIGKFSVFWGVTGDRVHINPDCWSFGSSVLYGTLDDSRREGRGEWCGSCSREYRGDDGYGGDERFLREGNPNIN